MGVHPSPEGFLGRMDFPSMGGARMVRIQRALLSVSDKSGLVEFARGLAALGVELLSTGGTAKALIDAGLKIRPVADVTKFPEMLDGRVKTLHPAIHGGLLAVRANPSHMAELERHGIAPIDLVAVNLYPFSATVVQPGVTLEEAVENIDIGGPSMIRSAAKNHASVAVLTDPRQYPEVLAELQRSGGELSEATRRSLARAAFAHTAAYDAAIASYLHQQHGEKGTFPLELLLHFGKVQDLRYGENPNQAAAFYRDLFPSAGLCVSNARQLHGKELSYNNIIDLDAALAIAADFQRPAAVVIKHTNPSGVASADTVADAFRTAYDADPLSAFGCVVGLNRLADLAVAQEIGKHFVEAVIAPGYSPEALAHIESKKNIRILQTDRPVARETPAPGLMMKVRGGLLAQTNGFVELRPEDLKVVTKRAPTPDQIAAMLFGVKVCRHIKSNAVLLVKGERTVGVGAGQMSRVDSTMIAGFKAKEEAKGSVLISDAFFPFRDGVDEAAKIGVAAIIQPGGSVRDAEVIAAADEHGIAMVFSGLRLFKH